MATCIRNGIKYKRHRWRGAACWFCGASQDKNFLSRVNALPASAVGTDMQQVVVQQQLTQELSEFVNSRGDIGPSPED